MKESILPPSNGQVNNANDFILSKIDTQTQAYYSVDTVLDLDEAVYYPTEFLTTF